MIWHFSFIFHSYVKLPEGSEHYAISIVMYKLQRPHCGITVSEMFAFLVR